MVRTALADDLGVVRTRQAAEQIAAVPYVSGGDPLVVGDHQRWWIACIVKLAPSAPFSRTLLGTAIVPRRRWPFKGTFQYGGDM